MQIVVDGLWRGWGAGHRPPIPPGSGGISCRALVSACGAWHSPDETPTRHRAPACPAGLGSAGADGRAGAGTGVRWWGRGCRQQRQAGRSCRGGVGQRGSSRAVLPFGRRPAVAPAEGSSGSARAVTFNRRPQLGLADSPLPSSNPSEISISAIVCGSEFGEFLAGSCRSSAPPGFRPPKRLYYFYAINTGQALLLCFRRPARTRLPLGEDVPPRPRQVKDSGFVGSSRWLLLTFMVFSRLWLLLRRVWFYLGSLLFHQLLEIIWL